MKLRRFCKSVALTIAIIQSATAAGAETANERFVRQAEVQTSEILALLVQGQSAAIWQRFDTDMAAGITKADFAAFQQAQARQFGAVQAPKSHAAIYYQDQGGLVAVDFSATTSKGALLCGFVLWSQPDTPEHQIRRIELNYLLSEQLSHLGVQQKAQLMVDFHCPVALIEKVTGAKLQVN